MHGSTCILRFYGGDVTHMILCPRLPLFVVYVEKIREGERGYTLRTVTNLLSKRLKQVAAQWRIFVSLYPAYRYK